MSHEPLFHWSEPLWELAGFLAVMLAAGAVGFRIAVLRDRAGSLSRPVDAEERMLRDAVWRRAALLGLAGAMLGFTRFAARLPEAAAERGVSVPVLVTANPLVGIQLGLGLMALIGFAAALGRSRVGWWVAGAAVFLAPLRAAITGQWARLVNPLHGLAAGLWIGTLFVLVVAGLAPLLRSGVVSERRGHLAARMIQAFSPLALGAAMALVILGIVAAARHLGAPAALWTTPYGGAFVAKMGVVAVVFALGAWNGFRQRPHATGVSGARALRRTAIVELVAAAIVLAVTSIVVSLPSPR